MRLSLPLIGFLAQPLTTGHRLIFCLLKSQEPDFAFSKPFGYLCFPNIVASSSNKLQARSTCCVFLGYAPHYEGYRCLDPITCRVYISHHVRFNETEFPYTISPLVLPKSTRNLTSHLFCGCSPPLRLFSFFLYLNIRPNLLYL